MFCFHLDVQKQNYKIHRSTKQLRQNQILLMRHQGMTVESGSEKVITEEDKWMSKHSKWDEDDASSSYVPPPQDDADEDEDSSGDDYAT
jgi:hypothetical protein